jgi:hypothetical protein
MTQDNRDILDVLKFELHFPEDGGYGRSPHAPWRAPAIFEDSPICPNFGDRERSHPCETCRLEQFVPQERRAEEIPCRYIKLTKDGQTIDDLYRTGSQAETEGALAEWLKAQIARIEQERSKGPDKNMA